MKLNFLKKKNKLSTSYKKYKNIKIGKLVSIKNKEKKHSKKYPRKVYAIKGSCFSDDIIFLQNNTIGIVTGYKYRKTRLITVNKPRDKKITIKKTKWFQILIENNVYLILENNVYLHNK
jgi:hypothetical protein